MLDNEEYYREGRMLIFTAKFLLKRGYCCGNGCKNCPYLKPVIKGNTELAPEYKNPEDKNSTN